MILRVLKKNCLIQPFFTGSFRNIGILTYIYIQCVCYLDFEKLKKDLKNLFSSCHKVNFKKTYFSHFSCKFSKKLTQLVTSSSLQLKCRIFFSTIFFITLQSMTVPNLMGHSAFPRDMIRQKYTRADSVKSTCS